MVLDRIHFAADDDAAGGAAGQDGHGVVLAWPGYWSAFDARRTTEGLSRHEALLEITVNGTSRRNRCSGNPEELARQDWTGTLHSTLPGRRP